MSAAMPVSCGVVGMRFGDSWARSIEVHPGLRLDAVCDVDPRVLAEKSALFGVRGFAALDELLASDVEAVALFTPAPLHAEQAIRALEAGKHVLCAVPAAMSLPDCQRLIEARERSGRQYMLAETSNWYPEVLHVKRLHEAGEMGRIFYYESEYLHESHTYWFADDGTPTWRHGWPILKYLTHNSGPVVMITGERMVEVTAYGWGERDAAWVAAYGSRFTLGAALFRMSGGAVAKITIANVIERPETVSFRFYGTKRSFESQRTRDEAHLLMTHTSAEPLRPEPPLESLPPPVQRLLGERPGHRGAEHFIVDGFAGALTGGTRPPIDVYDAVAYTAPGICAQQSMQEGRTVQIPDFGRARGETWRA